MLIQLSNAFFVNCRNSFLKHLIFHTKTFLSVSLIAVFLAFSSINLQAQKDSVYVTKSSLDRTIGLELKYKTHFTSIQQQNLPDIRLHNQSILLGLRVRYKIVNLAVSFPIYSFQENNNSFIDAYGAFLKAYPKNSLITGQFKYLPLKSIEWVPSFGKLSETIQNTAYLFQSNILASYSFKGSKLSFSSVYSFVDRQKKTAGSWLVTSSLDYYALVATRPDFEEKAFNFYTLENLNKLRLGSVVDILNF